MVYDGSTTKTALGYTFSPVGSSPDVDVDAKPERPPDKPDPDNCTHDWEVTGGIKSTCTLPGSVESTCSKCKKTKTEPRPRLGRTWEVKQSTQTAYDEKGNVLTQGFTIGEALGILWTWLPAEVMLVLVAGVTVFAFLALLKLFMK